MNPQGQGDDNAGNQQDDSLTKAESDNAEQFWYDDVGNTVEPCSAGVPAPTVVSQDKKHWVEIALVDQSGNPIPGESYSITVPGGGVVSGKLNAKGRARVEGIDPGNCKITFPDLDQHAWKPR